MFAGHVLWLRVPPDDIRERIFLKSIEEGDGVTPAVKFKSYAELPLDSASIFELDGQLAEDVEVGISAILG